MKKMVRYANENAKVYLMGTMEHFDQWNLVDLVGKLDYPGVDGLLVYPITQESLEKVLCASWCVFCPEILLLNKVHPLPNT